MHEFRGQDELQNIFTLITVGCAITMLIGSVYGFAVDSDRMFTISQITTTVNYTPVLIMN